MDVKMDEAGSTMADQPRMSLTDDDVVVVRFPEAPRRSLSRSAWLGQEGFPDDARRAFARLIDPIAPERFVADYWETRPLVVSRHDGSFYRDYLSLLDVDEILASTNI